MSFFILLRSRNSLDFLSQRRGFTMCAMVLQTLLVTLMTELLPVLLMLLPSSGLRS
jgi:hypothetical protein